MQTLDAHTCFALILSAHAFSVVLSTAEFVAIQRSLLPGGELDIEFATSERSRRARRLMAGVNSGAAIGGLLIMRAASAVAGAWLLWTGGPAWVALAPFGLLTAWRNLRFASVANGSWIAEMLVCLPALLWSFNPGDEMLARVCLAVIAAHFCIAYFGAGLAKVSSSGWRNGKSLTWTCNHGPFVVPVGRLLLKQPSLAIAISWVVIVFELGFVFSLVSGPEICLVILIVGACFHLLNSLLFGVHWFLWTFVGAYPAVWHTMRLISDAINIW